MSDKIDDLKKMWQDSRVDEVDNSTDIRNTILIAKQQMRRVARLQLTGIIILIIVGAGLWTFFVYVARFRQTLSHIGMGLMIGGLLVRIVIEMFSIYLSTRIDLTDSALNSNNASLRYFRFRGIINGPLTTGILIVYTIGFYMLTPEFSIYFSVPVLIMIDLSYLVAALIFISFIRHAVKKEMKILKQVLRITNDLVRQE